MFIFTILLQVWHFLIFLLFVSSGGFAEYDPQSGQRYANRSSVLSITA